MSNSYLHYFLLATDKTIWMETELYSSTVQPRVVYPVTPTDNASVVIKKCTEIDWWPDDISTSALCVRVLQTSAPQTSPHPQKILHETL